MKPSDKAIEAAMGAIETALDQGYGSPMEDALTAAYAIDFPESAPDQKPSETPTPKPKIVQISAIAETKYSACKFYALYDTGEVRWFDANNPKIINSHTPITDLLAKALQSLHAACIYQPPGASTPALDTRGGMQRHALAVAAKALAAYDASTEGVK